MTTTTRLDALAEARQLLAWTEEELQRLPCRRGTQWYQDREDAAEYLRRKVERLSACINERTR